MTTGSINRRGEATPLSAIVVLVAAALVAVVLPAKIAHAVVPGASGKIVFNSTRNGNYQIFTMNADGSAHTRLTDNSANDSTPTWSPDGKRIAFESNRDGNFQIYVMNADGSSQTRTTHSSAIDSSPAWSPDGKKIAFMRGPVDQEDIWTINADGSGEVRLTSQGGRFPDWSPDGSKIAFDSQRSGGFQVYVMNADGSGQTNLSHGTSTDGLAAWSPNSTKIAFISDRDGNREIYSMNADGSSQTRLTDSSGVDEFPAWSPDSTQIAFTSHRDGPAQIYTMNADGSNPIRISNNSFDDDRPDWGIDSGGVPPTSTTTSTTSPPTTTPPTTTPTTTPPPGITIAVGQDGGAQRTGGAVAPAGSHWVVVDFHNFLPNTTYSAQCIENSSVWYTMTNLRTDGSGNGHYTDTCFWGSADSPQVGVLASNNVLSNVILWPPSTSPPPPAANYKIVTDGRCANARTGPGTAFQVVTCLANGTPIAIECQTHGGTVFTTDGRPSNIWDRLSSPNGGSYVSDIFTSTPAFNAFSPGLSDCSGAPVIGPPVPTAAVTIAVGQDGGVQRPGGAVAPAGSHWVIVDFHNFAPNATYSAQCIENNSVWHTMTNLHTDGSGNGHYTDTCFWGSADSPQVGVLASNNVLSNVILWPPVAPSTGPPPSAAGYKITTSGSCANLHTGPTTSFATVACLPNGTPISIECQTHGEAILTGDGRPSDVWDRLSSPNGGSYVSDVLTNTPAFNAFSPGFSQCAGVPPVGPPGPPSGSSTKISYVVGLGDSIAAGYALGESDGAPTANPAAYPHVLAAQLGAKSNDYAMAGACAASPGSKEGAAPGTPAPNSPGGPFCTKSILTDQLPRIEGTPDLITITVGGDDIQFGECFKAVVGLTKSNPCEGDTFKTRLAALGDNLGRVVSELRMRYNRAKIVFTTQYDPLPGYPQAGQPVCPLAKAGLVMRNPGAAIDSFVHGTFDRDAATFQGDLNIKALTIAGRLNGVVRGVASKYGATVVTLDFGGHDLCHEYGKDARDSWVFAPSGEVFGLVDYKVSAIGFDFKLVPADLCPKFCFPFFAQTPPPFTKGPVTIKYTIAIKSNGLPHPTTAGQIAIANAIRRSL